MCRGAVKAKLSWRHKQTVCSCRCSVIAPPHSWQLPKNWLMIGIETWRVNSRGFGEENVHSTFFLRSAFGWNPYRQLVGNRYRRAQGAVAQLWKMKNTGFWACEGKRKNLN